MICDTKFTMGWPPRGDMPVWLTVGNFDGVHLGHQALIRQLIENAKENNAESVLINFWPNPKVYFSGESGFYLTTRAEKTGLLSKLGIDDVVTLDFDVKMAVMDAATFSAEVKQHFNLKGIVVGTDFAFGRQRQGTTEILADLCEDMAIELVIFPPIMLEESPVSSSRIRLALTDGKVDEAAQLLGRPYAMCSRVISGERVGKSIGVPTANLQLDPDKYLPKKGVYATIAHLRKKNYPAVTNVGIRPTFGEHFMISVETLILDFNDDIYGEDLRVEFIQWLRPEKKFHAVQELVNQIEEDKIATRRIFENGLK